MCIGAPTCESEFQNNFGAQDQVVYFKFPLSGNYREELHGLDNLKEVSAGGNCKLSFQVTMGRSGHWKFDTYADTNIFLKMEV
ncbi:hypothetical protein BGV40_09455 [Methanosarcina sp. Ant1]|nr:hypothetical protein BGV40_09455 [Methanosarcina sp. Ant1]